MKIKTLIVLGFIIFDIMLFTTSCKEKTQEEIIKNVQSIYDKKGMQGFLKYLEKNNYLPVKDSSQNGATPFLISIKNGDFEKLKYLIEKGALYEEKDNNGNDCIDYGLDSGNKEIINYLVTLVPVSYWNIENKEGQFPCVKFIEKCSDYTLIKSLFNLTKNLSAVDNKGKTLLMYASQNNTDVRVTKYLLDNDITLIDLKNNNEWSAVMYAARYNPNPLVLEDLLLRGAQTEPNSVGLTLTMLASCNKNAGVLFTLLKYKNEVNEKTLQGKTALMYACENKQDPSVIKILIDNGVDINARDTDGKTALMYSLEHYERPDPIYLLISAGAKTDIADNNGKSALYHLEQNEALNSTDLKNALEVVKSDKAGML